MSWPVVDQATFSPAKCLVTGDIDGPFFDFGDRVAYDPRLYIHVSVIEAAARQLGMVPRGDLEEATQRIEELEAKAAAWDAYRGKEPVSA